jgi:hypothetical protein
MGMATNTDNAQQIEQEFEYFASAFSKKSRLSISLIILFSRSYRWGCRPITD